LKQVILLSIQRRDSLPPSIVGPSTGDGATGEGGANSQTGQLNPSFSGVKASQPVGSGNQFDPQTTARLRSLEQQHIAASHEVNNFSTHLDGGLTGAGEAVGGTSGLQLDRSYGDPATDQGDTGRVVG
jgi:hypothetical protein